MRAFASPTNVYEVSDTDTAATIVAVINGTTANPSTSEKYDGIHFTTAKTYALADSLDPRRDFSVETDAAVTFTGNGFSPAKAIDTVTLSFEGNAPLTLEGATRGVDTSAAEGTATVKVASGAALNITGMSGYGMTTTGAISVAGTLDITNCGTSGSEGGFRMAGGTLSITDGGHMSCFGSGATGSGDFYTTGSVTVSDTGSTLDVGKPTQANGTMTLASGATLTIRDGAVVTVTQDSGSATKSRAIDLGPTYSPGSTFSAITVERSGKLIATVTTSDSTTSAIRGGKLDVSGGGIVEASASNGIALDGVTLNAGGTSLVTAEGSTGDAKTTSSTTITGGSVLMRPAQSVVNGQMTAVTNGGKVDPTPVNNEGESLTRFDLSKFAGKQISIAAGASTSTPAYIYEVGSNHNETAYVWAPAVRVRFYDSKDDCPATTTDPGTTGLLATDYTIRGNSVSLVNGIVPTAPSVKDMTFVGWVDKATNKIVDPSSTSLSTDVDLYPGYVPVTAADVPIDVYVDDGTGSETVNFINGPHSSSVGEKPMYETTLNLSTEADKAASFGDSVSRLTGSLTLTMTGSAGLAPASGTTYSSDISTYFAGGAALGLFDLVAAPTYDASTNTTTFQLKVKDDYSADSYKGTGNDLANLINGDFLGVSRRGNFDFATTSSLATEGYARMKVALSGTLTVWKADTAADGTTFQMTGVQDTSQWHSADPTLGTYGTADPLTTVSATLLHRTPVTLDTSTTAVLDITTTGSGFAGKTFGFSLAAGTAAYSDNTSGTSPLPGGASDPVTGSATFSAAGTQAVSFGSITFERPGTYQYTITETTPSGDGWTCDTSAKTVTITVTEDSTGKLTATVGQAVTISNSYVAPATDPATPETEAPSPTPLEAADSMNSLPDTGDQSLTTRVPMLLMAALVMLVLAFTGRLRNRFVR